MGAPAKLYVITGSHACTSAMLMLEHKQLEYELVKLPSGMHPVALRVAGFTSGVSRHVDGRPHRMVALAGRLGTVPSLRMGDERVASNRSIARFLEARFPSPRMIPEEPARRRAVEDIERWGDEVLQMVARRLILCAGAHDRLIDGGARGRLGPLLYTHALPRRVAAGAFSVMFVAGAGAEAGLLGEARAALDQIDEWLGEGLLDADELSVADFMLAPSVALLDYHRELRGELRARPARGLLDRLLADDRLWRERSRATA